jgi:hypothetical protein
VTAARFVGTARTSLGDAQVSVDRHECTFASCPYLWDVRVAYPGQVYTHAYTSRPGRAREKAQRVIDLLEGRRNRS